MKTIILIVIATMLSVACYSSVTIINMEPVPTDSRDFNVANEYTVDSIPYGMYYGITDNMGDTLLINASTITFGFVPSAYFADMFDAYSEFLVIDRAVIVHRSDYNSISDYFDALEKIWYGYMPINTAISGNPAVVGRVTNVDYIDSVNYSLCKQTMFSNVSEGTYYCFTNSDGIMECIPKGDIKFKDLFTDMFVDMFDTNDEFLLVDGKVAMLWHDGVNEKEFKSLVKQKWHE